MEDCAPVAGAEIPGAHAGVVRAKVVECGEMALREVEDVDVIADCGAVGGFVVWGASVSAGSALGR